MKYRDEFEIQISQQSCQFSSFRSFWSLFCKIRATERTTKTISGSCNCFVSSGDQTSSEEDSVSVIKRVHFITDKFNWIDKFWLVRRDISSWILIFGAWKCSRHSRIFPEYSRQLRFQKERGNLIRFSLSVGGSSFMNIQTQNHLFLLPTWSYRKPP
jgi:hypothetical protein